MLQAGHVHGMVVRRHVDCAFDGDTRTLCMCGIRRSPSVRSAARRQHDLPVDERFLRLGTEELPGRRPGEVVIEGASAAAFRQLTGEVDGPCVRYRTDGTDTARRSPGSWWMIECAVEKELDHNRSVIEISERVGVGVHIERPASTSTDSAPRERIRSSADDKGTKRPAKRPRDA
jgi:hypothetical protein